MFYYNRLKTWRFYTSRLRANAEENNQIFASKYKLYLPTEEEFKKELNLNNYVKKMRIKILKIKY